MYYVYVIKNEIGERYIGYSKDLRQRIKSHNGGFNKKSPMGTSILRSI